MKSKEQIFESLLRDGTKRQMEELNRTIKSSGGDIHDNVRKSQNTKEDKMSNTYYMDNPFDSKRTSIETQEHFVKNGAHYRTEPMKSKDPKKIKKTKMKKTNEELEFSDGMKFDTSGPLRKEEREDGWYVIGNGMLIPVRDEQEADEYIDDKDENYGYHYKKQDFYKRDNNINIEDEEVDEEGQEYISRQGRKIPISRDYQYDEDEDEDLKEYQKYNSKKKSDKTKLNLKRNDKAIKDKEKLDKEADEAGKKSEEKINESKKSTKKEPFIPTKKLKNLKSFYEICDKDGNATEKSDVNDDSWIKGSKEDKLRPMFVNLPDSTIRPSYDVLRTGKMIAIFGKEGRIVGIKNGQLYISVMNDETNKHETIKYDMEDVVKELKKSNKKSKKDSDE